MVENWWETEGFKKFPQAKVLDDLARKHGFVPVGASVKVLRLKHEDTDLPLDIAPLAKGANIWTLPFDDEPENINRTDYSPDRTRNTNLQTQLSVPQAAIAWKVSQIDDVVLKEIEKLLQNYLSAGIVRESSASTEQTRKPVAKMKEDAISENADNLSHLRKRLKQIEDASLETEEVRAAKQRKFQADLRILLLKERKSCEVCGIKTKAVLIASHIKPWKDCKNSEKVDLENLLLLSAHFDNLFDKGLISFDEEGTILISSKLDSDEISRLRLSGAEHLRNRPSTKMAAYLAIHRKMHGFK